VCLEPPAGSAEDGVAPDLLFLRVPEGSETVLRTRQPREAPRSGLEPGIPTV
jgi:hypothetical protein